MFKKVKNTAWVYVVSNLNCEEIVGKFYEKELQKKSEFRVEKVIKRDGNKLYVKGNDYDNSFNNWIDKKDIVIKNYLFSRTTYP